MRVDAGDAKGQLVQGGFSAQLTAVIQQRLDYGGMADGGRRILQYRAAGAGRKTGNIETVFNCERQLAVAKGKARDKPGLCVFCLCTMFSNHVSHLREGDNYRAK